MRLIGLIVGWKVFGSGFMIFLFGLNIVCWKGVLISCINLGLIMGYIVLGELILREKRFRGNRFFIVIG